MQKPSPAVSIPAEWAPHRAIWTAWPSDPLLWQDALDGARAEVAAMILALADGDSVKVLADGELACASARAALGGRAEVIDAHFGDIWLRDTGPIFTADRRALSFRFNGWGGKYVLDGDAGVADFVAAAAGAALTPHDFVLEGGAIEMDGRGTLITTKQCLLNENRNPGWSQKDIEALLKHTLGVSRILWLDEGLMNDHTDGHIDNLVRFVGPGRVVCQAPVRGDPNARLLDNMAVDLAAMSDAQGRMLEVFRIPSPGLVEEDGEAVPASHMNFLIGNKTVVMPTYGPHGEEAATALARLFPDRNVVALPSREILTGGGSFHCITQQEPA
jgi:agmatine deiminase